MQHWLLTFHEQKVRLPLVLQHLSNPTGVAANATAITYVTHCCSTMAHLRPDSVDVVNLSHAPAQCLLSGDPSRSLDDSVCTVQAEKPHRNVDWSDLQTSELQTLQGAATGGSALCSRALQATHACIQLRIYCKPHTLCPCRNLKRSRCGRQRRATAAIEDTV